MAYSDIQDKLGQIKMANMNQIHSKIPPGKGGSPGQPYDPPKPTGPYVPSPTAPTKLAMDFNDTGLGDGGFISTDKPHIYINRGAEAYILMPDGDFRFDGMYDPKRHGNAFPGLGLVQANANMKIAKGFVKNVGEPIGVMSATQGMKIIDDTETNPLKKELRRIRMFKNNPIDPGLVQNPNSMTIAQRGADGAHTNVKIYEEKDGYGNTYKKVLPYFGGTYGGPIRLKKT